MNLHKMIVCLCMGVCLAAGQPLYDYSTAEDSLVDFNTVSDLVYAIGAVDSGNATKELHIDVYSPQGLEQYKKAAILYIHGGSFRRGDKEDMRGSCEYFARRGFVTFSIQYRLEGDNPPARQYYPASMTAAFADAKAALRWIHANSDTYGIDPNNIFIGGTSAGAITALFAGVTNDDEYITDLPDESIPEFNNPDSPMDVQGIIDFCGGLYWEIDAIDANDPPILIFHGTEDQLVNISEARAIRDKCLEVGLAHEYYEIEGGGHCPIGDADNGKNIREVSFDFYNLHMNTGETNSSQSSKPETKGQISPGNFDVTVAAFDQNISMDFSVQGRYSIHLIDCRGRTVKTVSRTVKNTLLINSAGLNSGVYTVLIQNGTFAVTKLAVLIPQY